MLTDARWGKEQELMRSVFPEFRPFSGPSGFGFEGWLKGRLTGRAYRVVLEAGMATYPQTPPHIRMEPLLGNCWVGPLDGRNLCVARAWQPARSTFANTVLVLIKYIEEQEALGQTGEAARAARL